jgi:alpha-L-rhamnosidase
LDVTIPANTAARVILPAADAAAVTEGGQRVAEVADIAPAAATDGDATFEIGSGTYQFACPFATAPKSH